MEAESLKRLQLATAYESMDGFLAYRDLLEWLEDDVAKAEMRAAQADPENTAFFRAYFTEWQAKKIVLTSIKDRMAVQKAAKIELEQEALNERPSSNTSYDTGGDTQLPGYNF